MNQSFLPLDEYLRYRKLQIGENGNHTIPPSIWLMESSATQLEVLLTNPRETSVAIKQIVLENFVASLHFHFYWI